MNMYEEEREDVDCGGFSAEQTEGDKDMSWGFTLYSEGAETRGRFMAGITHKLNLN